MNLNEQLITDLYSAFQRREGEKMASCYDEAAIFSDPAFGTLRGPEIGAMWRMLCGRATDLRISFDKVSADEHSGKAHWEAWYTFSASGRPVHNVIEAAFEFRDGKIVEHHDSFNFWRWASMALGPVGTFAGWLPLVQRQVRSRARQGLNTFMMGK
ncbi:MAG TPA: nuclear transport factor 2 family protein [Anaerolineales bacterium]